MHQKINIHLTRCDIMSLNGKEEVDLRYPLSLRETGVNTLWKE